MKLFPFQKECVDQLAEGFKTNKVQCLSWYTGAGKTNVFLSLIKQMLEKDKNLKIAISAYITLEIKEQIFERLDAFGLKDKAQMINGSLFDETKNIYVFNPQGLYKKPPPVIFDLFVIDESHVGLDESCLMLKKIRGLTCNDKTKTLLVSATSWDTLAQKEFKEAKIFNRPLDQGFKDGLITDFKFHAEEALITFTEKDFNRVGDLGMSAAIRNMAILKSACIGKMEYLLKVYDKEIGKKCLVICPPGNYSETARELASAFDGLAFTQSFRLDEAGEHQVANRGDALSQFKEDPKHRFLFVTKKCQVGFDMESLSSVIDLTMSRNIKVLAQRCGRVARKNGKQEKHYFYVYDQSLMKDRLEWLIATMIDFCLGHYEGWTTKTAKYKKVNIHSQWSYRAAKAITISSVIKALRENTKNQRSLSYIQANGPPMRWNLERARAKAAQYSSRTDMWAKEPALYKWFRLNAKKEMDQIFPLKHFIGKWNLETVTQCLIRNQGLSRKEFSTKFSGMSHFLDKHEGLREKLYSKYLIRKVRAPWADEEIKKVLRSANRWEDVRFIHPGLGSWFRKTKTAPKWKVWWKDNVRWKKWSSNGQAARGKTESAKQPERDIRKSRARVSVSRRTQKDTFRRTALESRRRERLAKGS